jgi:glutamine synthetase
MDIPAETAISEAGMGQYEINLTHGCAMKAADDTWLFKLLVKGLARRHGFAASFMAKPYSEHSGTGMHVHFSVCDRDGRNLFDDGTDRGTPLLRHAIAGCLAGMPPSALIFAPHGNSYDRFAPGATPPPAWHGPTRTGPRRSACPRPRHGPPDRAPRRGRGHESLSPPRRDPRGRARGHGGRARPAAPVTGNAYSLDLPQLPRSWAAAIAEFESSSLIARILPDELVRNFLLTKRQEMRYYEGLSEAERLDLYLDTV